MWIFGKRNSQEKTQPQMPTTTQSKLEQLADLGQSIWLDNISRPLIETGKLQAMIDNGLRGLTSNPSIFNQSISSTTDYDAKILELKKQGKSTFEIYDELTVKDIQDAADIFKPVFEKTQRLDGYVSLEINPLLANEIQSQIDEGVRLFKKVNRANVMIKVPATEAGLKVFEKLTAQGINVNVTLIFSEFQYVKTVWAYIAGLERLAETTSDLSHVHSVASVFVSRVDTNIDKKLMHLFNTVKSHVTQGQIPQMLGRAAVANCRLIHERCKKLFGMDDFKKLQAKKANLQRVLWGSTSCKNPQYSDIKYVSELIAPNTVNTLPEKTINAFLDHGEVKLAFTDDPFKADQVIRKLKEFDAYVIEACEELLIDGVKAFDEAFESLLASIEKKAQELCEK